MKAKFTLLVVLASLVAFASGCALFAVGAAAGAGYAYAKGELKTTEPAPMDRTWDATVAAVKELQFPIVEQSKDALEARLVAKKAQDKDIRIKLNKVADNSTELHVRVGAFGDEAVSHEILDRIRKRV
jgi:hypothetical protein